MKIDWTRVKEGFTIMDVLKEENKELCEENNRLNNIINELEKWLKYQINKSSFEQDYERKLCYEDIFEELQELKGSDKEWVIKSE